ncbi:BadF/BadG/BcrA/BcrD ATPase family protein [Halalkalibacter sp. APA_J-10(15)]|uniref:BadF/BadG/BcrA/BcrD ATPase family protein n=1 Tax=Halalkalibacter sp. APA_J-10(15) TaxID=2933805 RepID=UPI001FF60FFE|nr:BadF/BadG/BcrA/BcrD ATPase family protein [Halalkalibacter sp. APA_J-10(15)]MCK0473230.1 ATPase [Halalkalibacter sp. APA_J-10(15)]
MSSQCKAVIGIDGGGSHTRVVVVDTEGNVRSYVERGASSIKKDLNAVTNAQQAIEEALFQASIDVKNVKGLTAGIAGLDSEEDYKWANELTRIEGLECSKWIVNDAVVAQSGAFLMKPGIVAISGTGSIIFAINEMGKSIRNYDFHHYAYSAARFLSYEAIFGVLSENTNKSDQLFIENVLSYWDLRTIDQLRSLGMRGFLADRRERDKYVGKMGPLVTEAAEGGSDLARRICDRAIEQLAVGIGILGSCFSSSSVSVACIGSVLTSPYMKKTLTEVLQKNNGKTYKVQEPILSSVSGAALMALVNSGVSIDQDMIAHLQTIK